MKFVLFVTKRDSSKLCDRIVFTDHKELISHLRTLFIPDSGIVNLLEKGSYKKLDDFSENINLVIEE